MKGGKLRYGFTTGACAAAAAKGAAQMLRDQEPVPAVEIRLPAGITTTFPLYGFHLQDNTASCYVVKDAGDDPDITNGVEIHATASIEFFTPHRIVIRGGTGIGRVMKPGLAVPVGEWAINPVPRAMIEEVVKEVFAMRCIPATITITISIPNGEELAKKTLNERLGIVGGLSILGTTGIVKPISAEAWTATIDAAVDVARACGSDTIVLSTGRASEVAVQKLFGLPDECYVMMGDHVAYAVNSCRSRGIKRIILAAQFAKLVKIGCGHGQTHVSSSSLDLQTLGEWISEVPALAHLVPVVDSANTARDVLEKSEGDRRLVEIVAEKARRSLSAMAPGTDIHVVAVGYAGDILFSC